MKFMYGCCVGSWSKFQDNVARGRNNRSIVALSGRDAIAPAYNRIRDIAQRERVDALVLMHDDLEITDHGFEEKVRVILNEVPDVALIGVAGGGGKSLYWWDHEPIGHQLTDFANIDFGQRTGEVDLIEGSIMVLSRWAITHLYFDTSFEGFYGYDEIGMQARHLGKRCVVADIDTHHHTVGGFSSGAESFARNDERYRLKWFGGGL